MAEIEVGKDFIMVLLNELRRDGNDNLRIDARAFDHRLMDIELGKCRVHSIVDRSRFDDNASMMELKLPNLSSEVPGYDDLIQALCRSMLMPPKNMDEVVDVVRGCVKTSKRRSGYSRQHCIAIDTNIAYDRLMTRMLLNAGTHGLRQRDVEDLTVIISNLAKKEVANASNRKFDMERDFGELDRAISGLRGEFKGTISRKARLAQNAGAEFASIRDRFSYVNVSTGRWDDDKERRDAEIVSEIGQFAKQYHAEVTFITADDKASALAEPEAMPCVVVRYPRQPPRSIDSDPWSLRELLYELAITFRKIDIHGTGISILSDWSGKTTDMFRREIVRIRYEPGSRIADDIIRDHRILERMRDIPGYSVDGLR